MAHRDIFASQKRVAYFCMEYGLHEEFHNYAGGLGILAGDLLKSAKDLNLPLVGVGLLWRQGYTWQRLDEGGHVYDSYPCYSYDFLKDTGIKVSVEIRGRKVNCKVWVLDKYGNAPLYLLDTNLPENEDRWITGQLYGWFSEERVAQEMVLGIGGVRALKALGMEVDVYHFNEGHAALAGIELIRQKMQEGMEFRQAWNQVRKKIVFTTHTPVKEGNEAHRHELLKYMGANNGLTLDRMIEIGGSPFNMTVAGLRLSRAANGVSQLHASTARQMWKDVDNAPNIIGITNGVHPDTWQDIRVKDAWAQNGDLWTEHQKCKEELLSRVKERTGRHLSPDRLLIGFARRSVAYKRSDFIFRKPRIIEPYLEDGRIQIVFSGKAHPLDDGGKAIVENLWRYAQKYPNRVVFLEDYDMETGRILTKGSDVWLNNPRRPLEASGTSGMKAAMNGVLNLSTLDGWWPEACVHGTNGWQFGDGQERSDSHDLDALYDVLLNQVVPTYYGNRAKWVEMMQASISMSHKRFSSERMLEEYYTKLY